MSWVSQLSAEDKAEFDAWIESNSAQNEFRQWLNKKRVHANGNPFYGRRWDAHVAACRRSGRDPYD